MVNFSKTPKLIIVIWIALIVDILFSVYFGRWITLFVSSMTLVFTVLPIVFAERFKVKLPMRFAAAIALFAFATLFLGEVGDFYGRFWWWDVVLHVGSAMGFGMLGFLGIFMLFEGDRFKAPPLALTVLSFCFALSIGTVWEIFEFGMDQVFGMNMQKSGLVDTMWDLIVDCLGAIVGSLSGYWYLKSRDGSSLFSGWIEAFVKLNKKLYRKSDDPPQA